MSVGERHAFAARDFSVSGDMDVPDIKHPGSSQIMQTGSVNVTSQETGQNLSALGRGYGTSINFMKPAPGAGEVQSLKG